MALTTVEGHSVLINTRIIEPKQYKLVEEMIAWGIMKGIFTKDQPPVMKRKQLRESHKALRGLVASPSFISKNIACKVVGVNGELKPGLYDLGVLKISGGGMQQAKIQHTQTTTSNDLPKKNLCGFLYMMHAVGTDFYKVGYVKGKNELAVRERRERLVKDYNRILSLENSSKNLQFKIVCFLQVNYTSESWVSMNKKNNSADWWATSPKSAEDVWHGSIETFHVEFTGKERTQMTEFHRFKRAEAKELEEQFAIGRLPDFPRLRDKRKLTWSVEEFRALLLRPALA
jgi:hypothetical protein